MNSDEVPTTIGDPDEAAWVTGQRDMLSRYLICQKLKHGGLSLEPRWFVSPSVAIWAVRSVHQPCRIGWWAISGDLPTDYVTCTIEQSDADVLRTFARKWKAASSQMAKGLQIPGYVIGPPGRERELAPMLRKRAKLLVAFADGIHNGSEEDK
jgi:hypothetical protein